MTNETLLAVDDIHVTYNHAIVALSGLSLTVGAGEIVALLGANGAGKSTTLKAVANLLPAERGQIVKGSIRFEGQDIERLNAAARVRRGIVQVLEGRHCFRSLTIEENLISGTLGRFLSRRTVQSRLDQIYQIFPRLLEKRRLAAGLASGGEQQMVAIGRALMSQPRLLVLDEPSMGLAPRVIEEIFSTLKKLNRENGMSLLVAEQNSTVALRYADQAFVLETGRVALSGRAAELRAREDIKAFYLGFGAAPKLHRLAS